MKLLHFYIYLLFTALLPLKADAQEPNANMAQESLRIGDVILIDLKCYICGTIKDETDSDYSHSGLVIGTNGSEYLIAQSLGTTDVVSSADFLSNRTKGSDIKVIRSRELDSLYNKNRAEYSSRIQLLQRLYFNKYEGTEFDREFLWDNYKDGKELLYCSEMIVKLLNEVLSNKISPKPMTFNKNLSVWETYFGEIPIPHGQPGTSPGMLERDYHFKHVMILR